jgi:hypothetical protein
MRSLKELADSLMKARVVKDTREKKEAAVQLTRTLVKAGRNEALQPVVDRIHKAGSACSAWYSIGMKSFRGLTLSAADDEDVTVEKSCDVCDHLYAIKIKAWKIRSCDCAAAPCPKCSAFQIVDLDVLRKDRFGACQ